MRRWPRFATAASRCAGWKTVFRSGARPGCQSLPAAPDTGATLDLGYHCAGVGFLGWNCAGEAGMNPLLVLVSIAVVLTSGPTLAQSQQPYAGLEGRSIKALSEQQIADLRAGRGMGLALAAELNGYPGPRHVLELAESLHLSDQQRAKIQELFESMKAETIAAGQILIAAERALDQEFAAKRITSHRLMWLTK